MFTGVSARIAGQVSRAALDIIIWLSQGCKYSDTKVPPMKSRTGAGAT